MSVLPASLRRLTPERLRDDVRLRALAVGFGLIPPRTMHSAEDARVLLDAAQGAKRVVEIGVYEGSSALALCETLGPDAELHLVDPFGAHPDALPSGWGATEWATRRVVARACARAWPRVRRAFTGTWLSRTRWPRAGRARWTWCSSTATTPRPAVSSIGPRGSVRARGGCVVFHDARADQPGGRGLPGPTAVVKRHFRSDEATPGWEITAEADRTVVVRRVESDEGQAPS